MSESERLPRSPELMSRDDSALLVVDVQEKLIIPNSPFGIVAGSVGRIGNPAIEGRDDWIVSVQETRLAGAHDFLVVPAMHTFIMNNEDVQKATLSFLQKGWFNSDEKRQPIPRIEARRDGSSE